MDHPAALAVPMSPLPHGLEMELDVLMHEAWAVAHKEGVEIDERQSAIMRCAFVLGAQAALREPDLVKRLTARLREG